MSTSPRTTTSPTGGITPWVSRTTTDDFGACVRLAPMTPRDVPAALVPSRGAGILIRHAASDGTARYLLQQRAAAHKHGGLWDTSAAGSLHDGEDPLDGALRELREELRTDLDLVITASATWVRPARASRFTLFLAQCPDLAAIGSPDPAEVMQARWCTQAEALALPLYSSFEEELRHFTGRP